ncbi:MAG: hypothetical protein M1837_006115 [Sclerophora amabilis]|nr:MAG: hypothetical protein M1837_006115 [Sclerophora amabilis]
MTIMYLQDQRRRTYVFSILSEALGGRETDRQEILIAIAAVITCEDIQMLVFQPPFHSSMIAIIRLFTNVERSQSLAVRSGSMITDPSAEAEPRDDIEPNSFSPRPGEVALVSPDMRQGDADQSYIYQLPSRLHEDGHPTRIWMYSAFSVPDRLRSESELTKIRGMPEVHVE